MRFFIFAFVCMPIASSYAYAQNSPAQPIPGSGTEGGNGGDVVFCAKDPSNEFEGYYSADYLAERAQSTPHDSFVEAASVAQSLDRIHKLFMDKNRVLAFAFIRFRAAYEKSQANPGDRSGDSYWAPAEFGLPNIPDEYLSVEFPKNCKRTPDRKDLGISQLVIRKKVGRQLVYFYHKGVFNHLKTERSLQASMAIVHEFGWDLTDDTEVVRQLNAYVHSKAAQAASTEEFNQRLRQLGLFEGQKYQRIRSEKAGADRAVFQCIERRESQELKALLESGADPNAYSSITHGDQKAAHIAWHPSQIDLLVEHGAEINVRDREGNTPLMLRAAEGRLEAVKSWLGHGADIRMKNEKEMNALHVALASGVSPEHLEVVKHLIAQGLDMNEAVPGRNGPELPLVLMVKSYMNAKPRSHTDMSWDMQQPELWDAIQALRQAGAKPVDFSFDLNWDWRHVGVSTWYPSHVSLLGFAILYGRIELARELVNEGADVNAENAASFVSYPNGGGSQKVTPLHWVAGYLKTEETAPALIRLLIEKGAKIEAQDEHWKQTPLFSAVTSNNLVAVRVLIEERATVNSRDKSGKTPLKYAAEMKFDEMAKLLRDAGGVE